ncbi:hypothetical protein D3C87_1742980 [compost metagenome]
MPCSWTMRPWRRGIIMSTPSRPPSKATIRTRTSSRSWPSSSRAGMVKATPAAIDSPAEPVVWTMLFSRMVARPNTRKMVMARTAMGMLALTVMPTLRARYTDEAAKTMPSTAPSNSARKVSSGGCSCGEM